MGSSEETKISEAVFELRDDPIFTSSNEWGIPDLRPDRLSDRVPKAVWAPGVQRDASELLYLYHCNAPPPGAEAGVLAFYIEDARFENVWRDAVRVCRRFLNFGWAAVVAPDFSVWRDDPLCVQIYNIYRSRWCARYWQEMGIPIIPSLNWSDERSRAWANAGIPARPPVVSVQCRTVRERARSAPNSESFFISGIIHAITDLQPLNVLIYGGKENRGWFEAFLPAGPMYHFLDSWTSARRKSQGWR